MKRLVSLQPQDVFARLNNGEAVLFDVREPDEYAREHVAGSVSAPMSGFEDANLQLKPGMTPIFTCRSGNRTASNCQRLNARVSGDVHVLEGGLDAWKAAGLPVKRDTRQPLELMRQVQMVAGGLILIGAALGTLVHPGFFGISAFVGAGLFFAGATGFCGMARLLAIMPWNRRMAKA